MGARGAFRADELTAMTKAERIEARRMGLATSDDEVSGDEKDNAADDHDEEDELKELDLAIKERHIGPVATQDYSDSSEDEDESSRTNGGSLLQAFA